jgi:CRISPR-associated protein Csh1
VGDFEAFRAALIRKGGQSASTKKGIGTAVKGLGQCCICGKQNTSVSGLLQIQQFKLYTLDKPGSVSGGFDPSQAWINFPACRECCDRVDFAGERVKKQLSFDYYGFKYLVLPLPVQDGSTQAYEFLDRLISARVNQKAITRLTAAEDELFYAISQERNLLQVDSMFYRPGSAIF